MRSRLLFKIEKLVNKFHIKVWLLVIADKPFTVWIFTDYYIKFCDTNKSEDQKLSIEDLSIQLTSIKNDNDSNKPQTYCKKDYLLYLREELKAPEEKIIEQDKQIQKISKMCVHCNVDKLKLMRNAVIVLGLDLIIDELYNIWLINVVSSPLAQQSSVTL